MDVQIDETGQEVLPRLKRHEFVGGGWLGVGKYFDDRAGRIDRNQRIVDDLHLAWRRRVNECALHEHAAIVA